MSRWYKAKRWEGSDDPTGAAMSGYWDALLRAALGPAAVTPATGGPQDIELDARHLPAAETAASIEATEPPVMTVPVVAEAPPPAIAEPRHDAGPEAVTPAVALAADVPAMEPPAAEPDPEPVAPVPARSTSRIFARVVHPEPGPEPAAAGVRGTLPPAIRETLASRVEPVRPDAPPEVIVALPLPVPPAPGPVVRMGTPAAPPPAATGPEHHAQPPVILTIDRIDIRVTPPAAAPDTRPRRRPTPPGPSLADFLTQGGSAQGGSPRGGSPQGGSPQGVSR